LQDPPILLPCCLAPQRSEVGVAVSEASTLPQKLQVDRGGPHTPRAKAFSAILHNLNVHINTLAMPPCIGFACCPRRRTAVAELGPRPVGAPAHGTSHPGPTAWWEQASYRWLKVSFIYFIISVIRALLNAPGGHGSRPRSHSHFGSHRRSPGSPLIAAHYSALKDRTLELYT